MRSSLVLVAGSASIVVASCAHRLEGEGNPPARGQLEARSYYYTDEGGLSVWTTGAQTEQYLSPTVSVRVSALADQIILKPPPPVNVIPPGPGQPTGHLHAGVDIITSASVLAPDSSVRTEKWRFEGIAGAKLETTLEHNPARVQLLVRGSSEPDYKSLAARLIGETELFERNTTVAAFVGGGGDNMSPAAPPPGQEAQWPAGQGRLNAGASITQLLSKVLTGSAGFGFTHQWGTLWSPYRRALVNGTLFPEVLPKNRERLTGFVALSYYLGGGTALHLRQGLYYDSWQIFALIPEAALAKEIGNEGLLSFRYRFYGQQAASFYRPVYSEILSIMSGDPRHGDLSEHVGSVELRWSLSGRPGWTKSMTLLGSYELSLLTYNQLRSTTRAQVFSLGLLWGY